MKIIIDGTPQELKEFLSCIPRDNTPPQRVENPELRKLAETLAGGNAARRSSVWTISLETSSSFSATRRT